MTKFDSDFDGTGKLFLDITCMVAYVSSMTNGGANYRFPKTIYNQQAEWERQSPAKPKLDVLFQDKELVTCREALFDFQTLVERMGGPGEKERTCDLIRRLHIVEDSPCGRVSKLQLTSNVKPRSRLIFSTAHHLGIVIVTANTGFVRSAASQVFYFVFCVCVCAWCFPSMSFSIKSHVLSHVVIFHREWRLLITFTSREVTLNIINCLRNRLN